MCWAGIGAAGAAGVVLAPAAVPAALGAAGFTKAGIAAGSLGAKAMSIAATANGGGVAAGSVLAAAQSVGAAGLGAVGNLVASVFGGAAGAAIGNMFAPCSNSPEIHKDKRKCEL